MNNDRPQGEWIIDGHHIRCNRCNEYICNTDREGNKIPDNFCSNCGAKMRTNRIGDEPFRCSVADSVETRDFDDYEDEPAPRIYRQMTGGEE